MTTTTKFVYSFGSGKAEGSSLMRNLLGGKGCELAEMTNLGIPVPPGFTITTQAWAHYNRAGREFPAGLWEQVEGAMARLTCAAPQLSWRLAPPAGSISRTPGALERRGVCQSRPGP